MSDSFKSWSKYWGLLYEDPDPKFPSKVYGFESMTGTMGTGSVPAEGGCYGFVASGECVLYEQSTVRLRAGQWFTTRSGCMVTPSTADTAVFVAQRIGYRGQFTVGGPIEEKGRLRYIDGCSDSLLACPPLLGDPCLNHLHFPGGIDQTEHTHPSLRAGIIARGRGYCETPNCTTRLVPNLIFVIPTDGLHKFRTDPGESMDVVPYHPDSDWGPTHEEHPMVIRAGESIRRWRSVARREADNFIAQDPLAKHCYLVKPIYDWSTQDVWTAPSKFGWDYNRTYDILQATGTTRHAQRVCPPYGEEPLQGLWQYAICWPELWEKMIHRVPGAATAARYSCSPLYAYGDVPGWDPDADPKELIAGVLKRWPADMRREIKHRVNAEIRNHYRKTREPIPAEVPGSTGVTWKFLYMLAVRGDIKERRNPKYQAEARKAE